MQLPLLVNRSAGPWGSEVCRSLGVRPGCSQTLGSAEDRWRASSCLRQSQEQACEIRTQHGERATYLSKFSSGLFFLHPPVGHQVVEHLTCKTEPETSEKETEAETGSRLNQNCSVQLAQRHPCAWSEGTSMQSSLSPP